ncbi:MAG TPA: HAMP domain-containing sensor histidine kinase [Candidatus Thermoplasmatota archaeon]|nr:HAMP domain-containing sensor histidine kinase [Candidatus Thermoplasmatota archaeon]
MTEDEVGAVEHRIVELEESEVRLHGLEDLRRVFVGEAAHELKGPLTPMLFDVEALLLDEGLTPIQRIHVAGIKRNVLRLTNLVHGMLETSRLETGRFKLKLTGFSLRDLLEEERKALESDARAAKVELEVGFASDADVTADRGKLGQVVHNLLANALAYTPSGGHILLTAHEVGGQMLVRVEDSGVGLTPGQLGQLFQPFSRPHETARASVKGTGLGLFISKGIIEEHHGRIWAESPGPGRGSAFCFAIPVGHPGQVPGPGGEAKKGQGLESATGP